MPSCASMQKVMQERKGTGVDGGSGCGGKGGKIGRGNSNSMRGWAGPYPRCLALSLAIPSLLCPAVAPLLHSAPLRFASMAKHWACVEPQSDRASVVLLLRWGAGTFRGAVSALHSLGRKPDLCPLPSPLLPSLPPSCPPTLPRYRSCGGVGQAGRRCHGPSVSALWPHFKPTPSHMHGETVSGAATVRPRGSGADDAGLVGGVRMEHRNTNTRLTSILTRAWCGAEVVTLSVTRHSDSGRAAPCASIHRLRVMLE